ncbi:hypothetical protein TNCV_4417921 [Trichonephila clavipes]|nr:hypothetical protein TNCV_4417921 [Trichonephila clavipes]
MIGIEFKASADIGEKFANLCNPAECHPPVCFPSPLLKKCSLFNDFLKFPLLAVLPVCSRYCKQLFEISINSHGEMTCTEQDSVEEFMTSSAMHRVHIGKGRTVSLYGWFLRQSCPVWLGGIQQPLYALGHYKISG